MLVLLTGANGQLGQAISKLCPPEVKLSLLTRNELDLSDPSACQLMIEKLRPDWVINAGAYTAVDKAENEKALAYAVNANAPAALASALEQNGGRMLQLSTDFVFDGTQSSPYKPSHVVSPIGIYGVTKAAGEQVAFRELGKRAYVLRTSWVYGPVGQNFLLTMLKMHKKHSLDSNSFNVVSDQIGCPTSTFSLAKACWKLIEKVTSYTSSSSKLQCFPNILHWSDIGEASWFDFAKSIGELSVSHGLLKKAAIVRPIASADYPTIAKRPSYSLLDCSSSYKVLDLKPKHWHEELNDVIAELASLIQI